MIFKTHLQSDSPERAAIRNAYLLDEAVCVKSLLEIARLDNACTQRISECAQKIVTNVRESITMQGGLDSFLHEYNLSSQEGIILMCLAEALLRIPDTTTANRLIESKLANADWQQHLGNSDSWFVNAATLGLMLTGRIVDLDESFIGNIGDFFNKLIARGGEPVIRKALKEAIRILGQQFVMGETIECALQRSQDVAYKENLFSYDMLGEAALTEKDAHHYLQAYGKAISVIKNHMQETTDIYKAPGVSIKLSALHPRFEFSQHSRVLSELVPRVLLLAEQACQSGISLTIDAEETDRLDITLDIFEAISASNSIKGWNGLGLAVQAYQKRAVAIINWLAELSRTHQRRIMLRLVKGAYWDTEIKNAQVRGLESYPVFTRKEATDVSYLACAKRILEEKDAFYPQFATHNAHTVATIIELAGSEQTFEFQRLHGMGEALYTEGLSHHDYTSCRVYAPVGSHTDLLPYLVRRLLENGANTSFVNRLEDAKIPVVDLIKDPVSKLDEHKQKPHPRIPLPVDLFKDRKNSTGINLNDSASLVSLHNEFIQHLEHTYLASPVINGKKRDGVKSTIFSPANLNLNVGTVIESTIDDIAHAYEVSSHASNTWQRTPVEKRSAILDKAADILAEHRAELIMLCIREGGRCLADAMDEVREAVDYCRYYAALARTQFNSEKLPGPTGEINILSLHGRGIFACISPWNFPIAIFTGQIVAALVTGNTVVSKPSRQTPLISMRIIELLHQAGVPPEALQLLPGTSSVLGRPLIENARLAGVVFTGSTDTARVINQTLANKNGPIVPLIAETGGQNVMIVDSSALPEQVVQDVLRSAFNSAGQRCSALRVLFLQKDIAARTLDILKGAMDELAIGDPFLVTTDIGPVIDAHARSKLMEHIQRMQHEAILCHQTPFPQDIANGYFVKPTLFEIKDFTSLKEEVFGPILHVIQYQSNQLDKVIESINGCGYGLTLGIHSRIESVARYIINRTHVGNIYVNRNMVGAVVGVQPFGGEGLSGTGPKAGGPNYLYRFVNERCVSTNTTAVGGNASLLTLRD